MWTCSLSRMAARDHHTPTRAQTLIYVPRFHFHQQLSTANPWQQTGCRTGGWSTLISLRPVSPPLPSPLQDSSRLQLQEEMVAGLTKERKKNARSIGILSDVPLFHSTSCLKCNNQLRSVLVPVLGTFLASG